jgi:hypothetical protein
MYLSCPNIRSNICSEAKRERKLNHHGNSKYTLQQETCALQVRWERLRKRGTHSAGASATMPHGYFHKDVKRKALNFGAFSSEYRIKAFRGKYKDFHEFLQHKDRLKLN